jgi:hypothetical protein
MENPDETESKAKTASSAGPAEQRGRVGARSFDQQPGRPIQKDKENRPEGLIVGRPCTPLNSVPYKGTHARLAEMGSAHFVLSMH